MAKKYIVRLTTDERSELEQLVNKGKIAAYKRLNAQILLNSMFKLVNKNITEY